MVNTFENSESRSACSLSSYIFTTTQKWRVIDAANALLDTWKPLLNRCSTLLGQKFLHVNVSDLHNYHLYGPSRVYQKAPVDRRTALIDLNYRIVESPFVIDA